MPRTLVLSRAVQHSNLKEHSKVLERRNLIFGVGNNLFTPANII